MITAAAITPHNPLLCPTIGKDNLERAQQTLNGFDKLASLWEGKKIDTFLIISPHGPVNEFLFTLNTNTAYPADLEEFGDFSTKSNWTADLRLAAEINDAFINQAALFSTSPPKLDHGSLVPLMLLKRSEREDTILPLYYSGLSLEKHFEFGKELGAVLQKSKKKIAIIASGDLAHTHSADSPAGYSPRAKKFDKRLIEALKQKKTEDVLQLDPELSQEVKDCGLKSILILLGILDKSEYSPQVLSYEAPFGVGYAVVDMGITTN